jgi:hypothetical protein
VCVQLASFLRDLDPATTGSLAKMT